VRTDVELGQRAPPHLMEKLSGFRVAERIVLSCLCCGENAQGTATDLRSQHRRLPSGRENVTAEYTGVPRHPGVGDPSTGGVAIQLPVSEREQVLRRAVHNAAKQGWVRRDRRAGELPFRSFTLPTSRASRRCRLRRLQAAPVPVDERFDTDLDAPRGSWLERRPPPQSPGIVDLPWIPALCQDADAALNLSVASGRAIDAVEPTTFEPSHRRFALLTSRTADLGNVGEVRSELEAHLESDTDRAPIDERDPLRHAWADERLDADLDRVLGQDRSICVATALSPEHDRQTALRTQVHGRYELEVMAVDRETSPRQDAGVVVVQPLGIARDRSVRSAAQDRVVGVQERWRGRVDRHGTQREISIVWTGWAPPQHRPWRG
jgi:hypothetical protein